MEIKLSLSRNDHQSMLCSVVERLTSSDFLGVTLVCEDGQLRVNRLALALLLEPSLQELEQGEAVVLLPGRALEDLVGEREGRQAGHREAGYKLCSDESYTEVLGDEKLVEVPAVYEKLLVNALWVIPTDFSEGKIAPTSGCSVIKVEHFNGGHSKYVCERTECDKSFSTSKKFSDHMRRSHLPIFKCNKCNRTTTNVRTLNSHKKRHHSKKECMFCNEILKDNAQYRRHYKKVHVQTKKRKKDCDICGKTLSSTYAFNIHMKSKHPKASQKSIKLAN